MRARFYLPLAIYCAIAATGCTGTADNASPAPQTDSAVLNPATDSGAGSQANRQDPRNYTTDVLLFAGTGTWSDEVAVLKGLLASHGVSYRAVTSAQLNAMTLDQMASYGTLVFPGGSGGTQASSLSSASQARLRDAVQLRGVSYVGFCAGSFIAVAPAPAAGKDVSYGLGVVDGAELEYYYLEHQGTDIAMTMHTFADGTQADLLWYGGPVTPNTGVVARYPNGDPAISEMWSGQGFVMLAGAHPSASAAMEASLGVTSSDGTHPDIAWKLIHSAMARQPLPTF